MNKKEAIISFFKSTSEFIYSALKTIINFLGSCLDFLRKYPDRCILLATLALFVLSIYLSFHNLKISIEFGEKVKTYAQDISTSLKETNAELKVLPSSIENLDSAINQLSSTVDKISINQDKFAKATDRLEQNVTLFGDKLEKIIQANQEQLDIWKKAEKLWKKSYARSLN